MPSLASLSLLLSITPALVLSTSSSKRGIVYVTPEVASDNDNWTDQNNDLTWYYNYVSQPTPAFAKSKMAFVPMQWGLPNNPDSDMSFYNSVQSLQKQGINITHVLGFNEPDACTNGGSCVDPKMAAIAWIKQMEPMRKDLNVKLGGPACTGAASGWTWLQNFHTACAAQRGGQNATGCAMDFLPIHWYGNFDGLAAHLGQVNATYKNVSDIWVTELGYPEVALDTTQTFYNESTNYLDSISAVERYAYFGPFRSSVSNIGPNVAFLTGNGQLTDIGSWYLGGGATGNVPTASGSATSGNFNSSAVVPGTYSGKPFSSASRSSSVFAGWFVCVAAATLWALS